MNVVQCLFLHNAVDKGIESMKDLCAKPVGKMQVTLPIRWPTSAILPASISRSIFDIYTVPPYRPSTDGVMHDSLIMEVCLM